MNTLSYNQELFAFLKNSPTPYHVVRNMEQHLLSHNYIALDESTQWHLQGGKSYFIKRADEAIIAFTLGNSESLANGFRMLAAHTDSPTLRIKPHPDCHSEGYHQLGVEVYGGCLLHPWFDRDLSIAGRICARDKQGTLHIDLIDFLAPIVTIPSLAIHFDREANQGRAINTQLHLPPILSLSSQNQDLDLTTILKNKYIEDNPERQIEDILGFDLFCYDHQPPGYTGLHQEIISGARLDNLLSCFAGMQAMSTAPGDRNAMLFCANHEENGSVAATGANGSFLESVFARLEPNVENRHIMLHNSFLISMDNAHATHPSHADKMDKNHHIQLNKGPVIKVNANQRYVTNSISCAVFKAICLDGEIPVQEFVMRSDLACGSTIGPITSARLGIRGVDIGAPSLAMHSIREHTGAEDPFLLYRSASHFLETDIHNSFLER